MVDRQQFSRTGATRNFLTVLLCGFAYCGSLAADKSAIPAAERVLQMTGTTQRLELGEADAVLIQFPEWLTQVRSTDAGVVRVTAVKPNCLRVTRLASGRTTMTARDRQEREYTVELSAVLNRQP